MMKLIERTIFFLLIGGYAISFGVGHASRLDAEEVIQTEGLMDFSEQIWPSRLDIGYRCGRFIGIKQNYAEAGLFLMQEPNCCSICEPYVDIRGAYLQKKEWAANGGFGVRFRTDDWYVWGVNAFYDHQKARIRTLQRVGLGFEFFSRCFDLTINGYYPLNNVRHGRLHEFFYRHGHFKEFCQEREYLYKGIDAEIGVPLWSGCSFSVYGGIGPYYYYSKKIESLVGGQARLEIEWAKYMSIAGWF